MSSSNHSHHTSDPNFILAMQNFRINEDSNNHHQGSIKPSGPVYENIEFYSSPTPSASIDQHLSHYGNFESSNKRAQPQVPTATVHNYHNSPNGQQAYGHQPQALQFQHQINQTQMAQRHPSNLIQSGHHYTDQIPIYENLPTAPKSHKSSSSSTGAQPQKPPAASAAHIPKAAIYLHQNTQHNNDTYVPHMPPYTVSQYSSAGSGVASVTQASAAAARYASNNTPPSSTYVAPGHYAVGGVGQYPSRVHSPAQSNISQYHQSQVII